ncbi:MAG: alpha/beta hydrolase [bacterium]|nr:alpha/beta hydrolase [bacterium]
MLYVLLTVPALALVVWFWRSTRTPYGPIKPVFGIAFALAAMFTRSQSDEQRRALWQTLESLQRMREGFERFGGIAARPVDFEGRIENRLIPGPGGEIPVRIYTPRGTGPFPVVIYLHGGAWILGSIETTDALTRSIALRSQAIVISVDYRMAPEHPFPAAINDVRCAISWARSNAGALGGIEAPLTVAGDSAGGNLAAAASLADHREGAGYIGFQVLIYPVVDLSNTDTESYRSFASDYGLTKQLMDDSIEMYVPNSADRTHPMISPLVQEDLTDLAPALVLTAGFDVLRDEGLAYVEKLRKAGVVTQHRHYPTLPHGFITMTRICREADQAVDLLSKAIAQRRNRKSRERPLL